MNIIRIIVDQYYLCPHAGVVPRSYVGVIVCTYCRKKWKIKDGRVVEEDI